MRPVTDRVIQTQQEAHFSEELAIVTVIVNSLAPTGKPLRSQRPPLTLVLLPGTLLNNISEVACRLARVPPQKLVLF